MRTTRCRSFLRLLVPLVIAGYLWGGTAAVAQPSPEESRRLVVFLADGVSFEELLSVPEVAALARSGGAALMSSSEPARSALEGAASSSGITFDMEYVRGVGGRPAALDSLGRDLRELAGSASREPAGGPQPEGQVLVVVSGVAGSPAMIAAKDEVLPVVVARGEPGELFPETGPLRTLASDTTRRDGVVTADDVAATMLDFAGADVIGDVEGSPVRIADAPAPFELHERYLAARRMIVPVGIAAAVYLAVGVLFALGMLILDTLVLTRLARVAAWVSLSVAPLAVGLLAAGLLPSLSYATAVPFVAGVTALGTAFVSRFRRLGTFGPAAVLGAGALAYLLAEALGGWRATLTPLLGGSALDGARFYGLPNAYVGLLLGAAVYVAVVAGPSGGFLVLAAAGAFAGLPDLGANFGGALTLFAAAGLWFVVGRGRRIGPKELGFVAAVVVAGMAVVLVANASSGTHIARAMETPGGLLGLWETAISRLSAGVRLMGRNPFALLPVIGVPVCLALVLRPPQVMRTGLEEYPAWRRGMLVLLASSAVAYFANDSGPAALGLGFGLSLGGILYVSLAGEG